MIIPNVKSEYGKLKEIIVGSANIFRVPSVGDKCLHDIDYNTYQMKNLKNRPSGYYPQKLIEETEEDLDNISKTLEDMGIKVHRPVEYDFAQPKRGNGHWEVDGYYNYCPRDSMLVVEDKVLNTNDSKT